MSRLNKNARVTETDGVSRVFTDLYEAEQGLKNDALLKKAFSTMKTLAAKMDEMAKREITLSKLNDADAERNAKIRALANVIKGYASMPIEETRQRGMELKSIFDKFGLRIISENYTAKSSLIEKLVKELSGETASAHIEALPGMSESLDALRQAQAEFGRLLVEYDSAMKKRILQKSASDHKKPLIACINDQIVAYLDAAALIDPEHYMHLAAAVDAEIDRANSAISARKKREKDSSAEKE